MRQRSKNMNFQQIISIFRPTYRRAGQAASRSQYWVQWSYTKEEWERFDQLDWARSRRWFYGTIILLAIAPCWWAIILPLFLQGLETQSSRVPSFFYIWMAFVLLAALVGFAVWIMGEWKSYKAGKTRHEQRQNPETERTVAVGPLGIYQSGSHIPLVGPNLRLRDVCIEPSNPSMLKFQMFRGRNIPTGISIPIPQGQEASAQRLIERFKQEVL
jgi:hypothetical protein